MTPQTHRLDPPPNKVPRTQKSALFAAANRCMVKLKCSGLKNAVLKMMAIALLAKDITVLRNVPNLTDVHMMAEVLRYLGAKVEITDGEVAIDARNLTEIEAPYELVSQLRASFVVLGPLLARCKEAKVSLPGGCAIGERRIDLHERGLKQLGAEVGIDHGYVYASAQKLVGSRIYLDRPSNGATENIMLVAVLAEGQPSKTPLRSRSSIWLIASMPWAVRSLEPAPTKSSSTVCP